VFFFHFVSTWASFIQNIIETEKKEKRRRKGDTSSDAFQLSKENVSLTKPFLWKTDEDCTVCKNGLKRGTDKMDK